MQQEILARGPIACSIHAADDTFDAWDGTGVITDDRKYNGTTHVIVRTATRSV